MSVEASVAATAIETPLAAKRSGRLKGNQLLFENTFDMEPPDFQL